MIILKILDVKSFMGKLFTSSVFDDYILKELEIQTFTNFHMNGQFYKEFFLEEELEEREPDTLWSDIRPVAFSIIKGKKSPLSMKVVLQLPPQKAELLLQSLGGKVQREATGGMYLNLRYDKEELRLVTGTAMKTFTLDKTLEQEWDRRVKEYIKELGIGFEEP